MKSIALCAPGLAVSLLVALCSLYIASLPSLGQFGISASVIAIILGMLIGNTVYHRLPLVCAVGVNFSKQQILRLAIILFGLKLTFQDIVAVGLNGIIISVTIICITFALAIYLGCKILKCDWQSTVLIGSGCSICGAAAIMATSPVIKADSEKISVAVATIVIFGTIAMFIYPVIAHFAVRYWHIGEPFLGTYAGSTIHEVAQVAVAGQAIGDSAANNAVIIKMIRVLMLAPFLLLLSIAISYKNLRQSNTGNPTSTTATAAAKKHTLLGNVIIPWFAIGFMLMAAINSSGIINPTFTNYLIGLDNLLLTIAMAALGLTTHYNAFKKAGPKPLLLALYLFIWLVIGGWLINWAIFYLF